MIGGERIEFGLTVVHHTHSRRSAEDLISSSIMIILLAAKGGCQLRAITLQWLVDLIQPSGRIWSLLWSDGK